MYLFIYVVFSGFMNYLKMEFMSYDPSCDENYQKYFEPEEPFWLIILEKVYYPE